jgi:hypothetical protein
MGVPSAIGVSPCLLITIFTKLGLTTEDLSHRRITAVLAFLRDRSRSSSRSSPPSSQCWSTRLRQCPRAVVSRPNRPPATD